MSPVNRDYNFLKTFEQLLRSLSKDDPGSTSIRESNESQRDFRISRVPIIPPFVCEQKSSRRFAEFSSTVLNIGSVKSAEFTRSHDSSSFPHKIRWPVKPAEPLKHPLSLLFFYIIFKQPEEMQGSIPPIFRQD